MPRHPHLLAALLAISALTTAAHAQHGASPPAGRSVNLQGEDPRKFLDNPYTRSCYDLSVASLRPGAPRLDMKAYEQKSFAIFHAQGESMAKGGGPGMVDHLKLIPRQIVQIAKDDPKTLNSFDNFVDALVGPK